jgi:glycosyltransferase involved in cell wall biosynthesis
MSKYIGVKNGRIQVVSDNIFVNSELQILKLPTHLENISVEHLISEYFVRNGMVFHSTETKDIKDLKVALVTNWKMRCGISTYGESLLNKLIPHLGDFRIFSEYNDQLTGKVNELPDVTFDSNQVIPCWKRGEQLLSLIKEIKKYNPDVIWFNHEWGLFPVARHFLAMLTQLSSARIIVTMHSTFHHKDKSICESAIPEIIVHLDGAKKILQEEKGVPGKIYMIPHGCSPCTNREKYWNLYRSEFTFVMSGFGFKYKRWEAALEATAILKQKHPNVFFTGLFSESPFAKIEHQKYFDDLMEKVSSLGIEENVAIVRGYQSDQSLDSYLRTNKVALFPYVSAPGHEVQGASGAARLAMSKGIPVVTSSIPHFQDLPTIKADTPQEMAAAIEALCLDKAQQDYQIDRQCAFLEETSWDNIALRYLAVFENKAT